MSNEDFQSLSHNTTIVLVEDDKRLASLISGYLDSLGFRSQVIYDGAEAAEKIIRLQPDLVILDYMLPGKDGISICKEIRPAYPGPVIMLTASDDELTEVSALNQGFDDYLTKPLRPHILEARVKAVLRRTRVIDTASDQITCMDLSLDPKNRWVEQKGQRLDITDAEYDLLHILMNNQGKIISREELFVELRGIPYDGLDRSIDQRVVTLRKKLSDASPPYKYIQSVRGKGYLLVNHD